jgi:hypothetical protein
MARNLPGAISLHGFSITLGACCIFSSAFRSGGFLLGFSAILDLHFAEVGGW